MKDTFLSMKILVKYCFITWLLLGVAFGQNTKASGNLLLKNYTEKELLSNKVFRDIVQHPNGRIYTANYGSVMEFDGSNWKEIELPENINSAAIDVSSNGIIYVGIENDIGFLELSQLNELQYKSLKYLLPDSIIIDNVTNITPTEQGVFCIHTNGVIRINEEEDKIVSHSIMGGYNIFNVDNQILIPIRKEIEGRPYLFNYNMEEDKLEEYIEFPTSMNKDGLSGIFKFQRDRLLIFTFDELHIYNTKTKDFESLPSHFIKLNNMIKEAFILSVKVIKEKYIISTLKKGTFVFDVNGNFVTKIDTDRGCNNNQHFTSILDRNNNIWVATMNNITLVETNSPFSVWNKKDGLAGTVYDICKKNEKYYVSTTEGVFLIKGNQIIKLNKENNLFFDIYESNDRLFLNSIEFVFEILDDNSIKQLPIKSSVANIIGSVN